MEVYTIAEGVIRSSCSCNPKFVYSACLVTHIPGVSVSLCLYSALAGLVAHNWTEERFSQSAEFATSIMRTTTVSVKCFLNLCPLLLLTKPFHCSVFLVVVL